MKLHQILSRALHYAIEDRMALYYAYHGEGPQAAEAKREAARFRKLHARLKLTPARKLHSVLSEGVESLDVFEIKKRVSAEAVENGAAQKRRT